MKPRSSPIPISAPVETAAWIFGDTAASGPPGVGSSATATPWAMPPPAERAEHGDPGGVDAVGRRVGPQPAHRLHAVVDGVQRRGEPPGLRRARLRVEAVPDGRRPRSPAGRRSGRRRPCGSCRRRRSRRRGRGSPAAGGEARRRAAGTGRAGAATVMPVHVHRAAVLQVQVGGQLRVGVLLRRVEARLGDGPTRGGHEQQDEGADQCSGATDDGGRGHGCGTPWSGARPALRPSGRRHGTGAPCRPLEGGQAAVRLRSDHPERDRRPRWPGR